METMYYCQRCEKELEGRRRKWCSEKCRNTPKEGAIEFCPSCNKDFKPRSVTQVFCKKSCSVGRGGMKYKKAPTMTTRQLARGNSVEISCALHALEFSPTVLTQSAIKGASVLLAMINKGSTKYDVSIEVLEELVNRK